MERKVSSAVGGTGLCAFFPKYIVHHIKAHKAAIELSDSHNVNQRSSSASKQCYRTRINALFILKGAERL